MIYEDDVVDGVARLLAADGWSIQRVAHAHERGDDIVALRGDQRLVVEAKGEGSSKPTARAGAAFRRGEVRKHVANAVFRAMTLLDRGMEAGIAFPDSASHRACVESVRLSIGALGIIVYFVDDRGRARRATVAD
ncbi:hypothetical protein [Microbacterium thalassium]|uniref:Uncharacterized protein n=1 Tax=Microbacterium thalassium TaxID=362649 RepID=A0A7X0FNE4_9MICO|nr:hypothetical protein [Microbacterium thalassium]MBB6390187.1 hypothetical protein [Microbacterium thalassium]GLK25295.1 hypothetical protein GCM10017607_26140 [Microbacterium thalassium]